MEGAKLVGLPDVIDADYCVVEIVKALNDSKKLAMQQNDTKTMLDVVAGWFELHERFVVAEEQEETGQRPFGFHNRREEIDTEAISEHEHHPFAEPYEETEETNDEPDAESRHYTRL
jgi:hypothetical protein